MNPGLKFFLAITIAIEISFVESLIVNLVLITVSLVYLLINHVKVTTILKMIIFSFLPALGLFVSQWMYGNGGLAFATILFTRIYAYIFVGATFTATVSFIDLGLSLEKNFRLPSKFAYGIMAGFNLMPKIVSEIKVIKTASLMRGRVIHFWSAQLYLKAIIASLQWSKNLSEAMVSHGFVEDQHRSSFHKIRLNYIDWSIFLVILILVQGLVFLAPY